MKTIIQSVKGTRDFYPDVMAQRRWLTDILRKVSSRFGFSEYEGPCLEKIDLYAAKSGEELVKEQAFVFNDRGGDPITLRPELTPTLTRMVAEKQGEMTFPLRWWAFGPFWRYERPQKGRSREFYQWNVDIIGANRIETDAELIAVAAAFLKEAGLSSDQIHILVNNRRLMDAAVGDLGVAAALRPAVNRLIDRIDKLSADKWEAYALDLGLGSGQVQQLKAMLDNDQLWRQSDEMVRLFEMLEGYGIADYVKFDPKIVRGLDYYTGTVFEAHDCDGEFRAIFGGGRYDNLLADVGGDALPGVGFAMGDVVIMLVLQKYGCLPQQLPPVARVLVTVFDESSMLESIKIGTMLRDNGINVNLYPNLDKMGKQFKYADKQHCDLAVIAGPDEVAQGMVTLKNLRNGTQETMAQSLLVKKVLDLLD